MIRWVFRIASMPTKFEKLLEDKKRFVITSALSSVIKEEFVEHFLKLRELMFGLTV